MPGLFQFAIPGNIKRVTSQKLEQMAGILSLAQHPCSKITSDFFFFNSTGKTDTWIYNQNGLPA